MARINRGCGKAATLLERRSWKLQTCPREKQRASAATYATPSCIPMRVFESRSIVALPYDSFAAQFGRLQNRIGAGTRGDVALQESGSVGIGATSVRPTEL